MKIFFGFLCSLLVLTGCGQTSGGSSTEMTGNLNGFWVLTSEEVDGEKVAEGNLEGFVTVNEFETREVFEFREGTIYRQYGKEEFPAKYTQVGNKIEFDDNGQRWTETILKLTESTLILKYQTETASIRTYTKISKEQGEKIRKEAQAGLM